MKRLLAIALVGALATVGRAEMLVQWGEKPTGAGTPGTNIVTVNQNFLSSGTTYSGNTNNPAVGANYYPDAAERSPYFSVAVSSVSYGGGRLVEQAASGDRLAVYGQTVPAGATFRGMVMWPSNYCLITDRAMTVTNVTIAISQRSNANTTDQQISVLIKQGGGYYISDALAFGANFMTQSFSLVNASWREFTPFSSGTETIGDPVVAPSFNNIQAIGYYFTARNGGGAAGACGALVAYFGVQAYETPAEGSQLLLVFVNNPDWGRVTPTGGVFATGQPVELTATASNHFVFTGWSGSLSGQANPATVTMSEDKTVNATFAPLLATNDTPHWWLAQYGLPTSDEGAMSDTDGDGLAAWQEYLAGSNPTSAPQVTAIVMTNRTALTLTFDSDLVAANASSLNRYALNSNLIVYAASLLADQRTVRLTTTYLPTGSVFTLGVSGILTTSGASVPNTNLAFSCTPDLGPLPRNLIGDPGFDLERSSTDFTNTNWQAVAINAGSSNSVELAGRRAWQVARFSAIYSTYVAGDGNGDPDTIRLNLDTFRVGAAGNNGTLIVQVRGVNGAAPTSDGAGVVLGTYPGTARFSGEGYTFSFDTPDDGAWHDQQPQAYAVGADYDWYIIRLSVFPNGLASGEPEFTSTAMGADDVVFTIDGHTAVDTVPPHSVTDLSGSPTPASVTLSWRNATEDDHQGVLILRRAEAPPTATPSSGTVYAAGQVLGDSVVVCHAPGTNRAPYGFSSIVDSGVTAGVRYYYTVYACDEVPNYSAAMATNIGPATTFWWDANGASGGIGGSGTWDSSSSLWRSSLSTDPLTVWPNLAPNTDEAILDGTAGTLNNAIGTINLHHLTFRANGFQVTNGVIALSGASPSFLSALNGVTGTVASAISGTNQVLIPGPGTVVLSGPNTFSGSVVVTGGTLRVDGQIPGSVTVNKANLSGRGSIGGSLAMTAGSISPGSDVGQLSVGSATVSAGTYHFNITNAGGIAGTDWDLWTIGSGAGVLDLGGASTGSITVNVVCATSTLAAFNSLQSYSWKIVDAGSIAGYADGLFAVRTASFQPPLNEGTFSIRQSAGDLYLDFTPATPVDLRVTVTAAYNPADVGASQTYTLVISNAGPEAVGTYYVTNYLGDAVSYISSSDGGVHSAGAVRWTLSSLSAQGSRTLTVLALNPLVQSVITNRVSVSGLRADPAPGNNLADVLVTIQCPGAPSPLMPAASHQSAETGHSLSFYVVTSNADCSPPASFIAAGMPDGSSFTVTTNNYTLTGLFSWPFTGAPGTYPIRFASANVTSQTNVMTVLVYIAANGEPYNGQGIPLSQTNWSVGIAKLETGTVSTAVLTWNATTGLSYDVYSTTSDFGDTGATWSKLTGGVAAIGAQVTQLVYSAGNQRYFQVVPEGISPLHRGVWAIIKPTINPGFSTFSPPLAGSDLKFDGDLGSNLASVLTGHNVYGMGDEVFILNPDNSYSNLYLDAARVWRAAIPNTPPATHQLQPGQGVIILRRQLTAAQPVFSGPVGNQQTNTNVIEPGFNILGLSEGRYLSLGNAFSSIESGVPAGSYQKAQADIIHILESSGAYTTLQRLPDGSWLDLATFGPSNRKFTPGRAYWYYRVPTAGVMRVRF